ncbi:hypothetical protein E3U55_15535 [Filobacillus milosensis]|uniref:Uncharacterized protein n=1 Tax=Filobacillus milosensis TaxID=94137 RepID=A0A4Y8IJA4_9BACI|nr:hypothetical protein [Filobacillus milosensis]TFB13668.1 hypothetical protein E3U55_15535 [Filobacillus milosensis]
MKGKVLLKRLSALLLIISFVFIGLASTVSANEKTEEEIQEEIHDVMSGIKDLRAEGATNEDIKKYLKKNGHVDTKVKSWKVDKEGNRISQDNDMSTNALDKSDRKLNLWATRHDRQYNYWIVYAEVTDDWGDEDYPGSDDLVSIHWDPDVFRFSDENVSETNRDWIGLASSAGINNGAAVFYLDDNDVFRSTNGYTASAWVILEAEQTGVMTNTGMDFIHTFNQENETENLSYHANIDFGGSEFGGGAGASYSISTSYDETYWSTADTYEFLTSW